MERERIAHIKNGVSRIIGAGVATGVLALNLTSGDSQGASDFDKVIDTPAEKTNLSGLGIAGALEALGTSPLQKEDSPATQFRFSAQSDCLGAPNCVRINTELTSKYAAKAQAFWGNVIIVKFYEADIPDSDVIAAADPKQNSIYFNRLYKPKPRLQPRKRNIARCTAATHEWGHLLYPKRYSKHGHSDDATHIMSWGIDYNRYATRQCYAGFPAPPRRNWIFLHK